MNKIGIKTPCSENWDKMTPSATGAFCQKCTKHVHDFSTKSINEIKSELLALKDVSLCIRMTTQQETELNTEFNLWLTHQKRHPQQLFIAALLIVFGFTLFSCEDEKKQQEIESIRQIAYTITSDADRPKTAGTTIFIAPETVDEEESIEDTVVVDESEVFYVEDELEEVQITPLGSRSEEIIMGAYYTITTIKREFLEQTTIELDENGNPYPTEFKAFAFPNPAVESTTMEIQVPQKEQALVQLVDLSGKLIREVYAGELPRGTFRQAVDLTDLPSGLYLIVIRSKDFRETVRVVKN